MTAKYSAPIVVQVRCSDLRASVAGWTGHLFFMASLSPKTSYDGLDKHCTFTNLITAHEIRQTIYNGLDNYIVHYNCTNLITEHEIRAFAIQAGGRVTRSRRR